MRLSPCLEREVWNQSFSELGGCIGIPEGSNTERMTSDSYLLWTWRLSLREPSCPAARGTRFRAVKRRLWNPADTQGGTDPTGWRSRSSRRHSLTRPWVLPLSVLQKARFLQFFPFRGMRPPLPQSFLCGPGPSCAKPWTLFIPGRVVQLSLQAWSPEGRKKM